jgi:sugar-specific transcriptional regulator TrmB
MTDGQPRFATDEDVPGRILSVLRDARKHAILVSPYLGLWGHLEDAITIAVRNGVEVTVVLRDEPDVVNSKDVGWLLDNGVKVGVVRTCTPRCT